MNGDHFYRFCEPESHIFFCIFPLRTFVIQQIPSSNLFMVVVENTCDCSSAPPVTMEPIEIIYILFINQLKPLLVEREVKAWVFVWLSALTSEHIMRLWSATDWSFKRIADGHSPVIHFIRRYIIMMLYYSISAFDDQHDTRFQTTVKKNCYILKLHQHIFYFKVPHSLCL